MNGKKKAPRRKFVIEGLLEHRRGPRHPFRSRTPRWLQVLRHLNSLLPRRSIRKCSAASWDSLSGYVSCPCFRNFGNIGSLPADILVVIICSFIGGRVGSLIGGRSELAKQWEDAAEHGSRDDNQRQS